MRTNINVQELTVAALLTEKPRACLSRRDARSAYAAELDLDQIWKLVDQLIDAHGNWCRLGSRLKHLSLRVQRHLL